MWPLGAETQHRGLAPTGHGSSIWDRGDFPSVAYPPPPLPKTGARGGHRDRAAGPRATLASGATQRGCRALAPFLWTASTVWGLETAVG